MASAILSGLAGKALEVVARPLYLPCIDEFQKSIQVLYKPEILDDYVQNLGAMDNKIKAMSCTDEINNWIAQADRIIQEYGSSNRTDDQRFCFFSSNACLRYKLQRKIRKLMGQGKRIITCDDLQPKRVEKIHYGVPPIGNDTTAGRNLKRVMDMLEYDAVWRIGLWGPGGVGKTTLARALNNELGKTSSFSMVIYVEITKDVDLKGMQKEIAQRLGEKVEEGMDTRHVAERIRNRLEKEKFLLIVDNVWERIDLQSIGIPRRQAASTSKIVLTTRLLDMCKKMEAKALPIGYLTDEEAWKLFAEKAGDVVDKEEIRPLAKTVCQECGGLPLAIIVVGSAMREQTDIRLWRNAINRLQQAIPIDDESQVYNALKLSYDRLEKDTLRFCFLYCSLYPEGYQIDVNELVGCWLAEEVIDEQLFYEDAFNWGLNLIEKMTSSCLLEKLAWPHNFDESYRVKMHDVVRDFARWIAEQNRCLIFSGHGISKGPVVKFPEEVNNLEWISFVDNKEIELPQHRKDFPKATTLLLRGTLKNEVKLPHEFLEGFQKLRVLNMEYVQSFPGYSLCLAELRAFLLRQHYHVEEIPCMPKLIILDLSGCDFDKIPRGLRESTHLKVLILSKTFNLKSVEGDIISKLTSLEVLDMRSSGYEWPTTKRKSNSKDEATLQDLSELKELKSVYLDLADAECSYEDCKWMERLQNFYYGFNAVFTQLGRTGRVVSIGNEKGKDAEVGSFVLHAESLLLKNVQNANEIFVNFNSTSQSNSKLKRFEVRECTFSGKSTGPAPNCIALSNLETLRLDSVFDKDELSFSQIANVLGATFPKLEYFDLIGGENMREVFHYGPTKNHVVAPNLRSIVIYDLPNLERLCDYELTEQWRSLEVLYVERCPKLKKLPHMPSIKEIKGEEEWWNNLEWDSPETKSYMDGLFKPLKYGWDV